MQCLRSPCRKSSCSNSGSPGKTAERNHLQMSERVISCGHGHGSIPSSRIQLPSMKLQHRFRTRFLALTACSGDVRMMLFNVFLLSVCENMLLCRTIYQMIMKTELLLMPVGGIIVIIDCDPSNRPARRDAKHRKGCSPLVGEARRKG